MKESIYAFLVELRVTQWVKNLLVFLPVLLSAHFPEREVISKLVLVCIAFCSAASAIYLWNDLIDLPEDRLHPTKRFRPLAAGKIPLHIAKIATPAFMVFAASLGYFIGPSSCVLVVSYLALSAFYVLKAKRVAVLDVIFLALFYLLRILAGAVAAGVVLSQWFIVFALLFFCQIGVSKRVSELLILKPSTSLAAGGRPYGKDDFHFLQIFGLSSGIMSVLTLGIYSLSQHVQRLYANPRLLLVLCLLLFYWVNYFWLATTRGNMRDPVSFILRDPVCRFVLVLAALIFGCSKFGW